MVLGLALALAAVPAVLASDADPVPAAEPTPTPVTDPGTPPCDGCGEISVDPSFEAPTPVPDPVSEDVAPIVEVQGITGAPVPTPPSTDTLAAPAGTPPSTPDGFGLVLLLVGAVSLVLLAGPLPEARRR